MTLAPDTVSPGRLTDLFQLGLDAPICLTWELTYACNLSCVHCLSSSGRRDPRELSTDECKAVIDTLQRMQVFYVNIGGGEPTVRPDFWELVDYATAHQVGVKFSTNGVKITAEVAARLAASDYVDVQISLDGATAEVNDAVRGPGSYATAMRAMQNLADAGFRGFKLSVVMTRQNIPQLDEFKAIADRYGAQLRLTRLRPSGRGADVWDELHPLPAQQNQCEVEARLAGHFARSGYCHQRDNCGKEQHQCAKAVHSEMILNTKCRYPIRVFDELHGAGCAEAKPDPQCECERSGCCNQRDGLG